MMISLVPKTPYLPVYCLKTIYYQLLLNISEIIVDKCPVMSVN